jgi:hypothetical protein
VRPDTRSSSAASVDLPVAAPPQTITRAGTRASHASLFAVVARAFASPRRSATSGDPYGRSLARMNATFARIQARSAAWK